MRCSSLLTLSSLFAVGLAGACTSSADDATYHNPDPLASPDLPNQCMRNYWTDLEGNVNYHDGWEGPVSTYREAPTGSAKVNDWSPLLGTTGLSNHADGDEGFVELTNDQTLPTQCAQYDAAMLPFEGDLAAGTVLFHTRRLVHRFPTFVFPALGQPLPTSTAPIVAVAETTLELDYEQPRRYPDGTYDFDVRKIVKHQSWPLTNVKCGKPFTIQPGYDADGSVSLPAFCRDSHQRECLAYTVEYTADDCTFEIKSGTVELSDGRSFRANMAGYFHKVADGYLLKMTNVEFVK
jgi:hypothetical protein